MKKIITLTLALLFVLCSCSSQDLQEQNDSEATQQSASSSSEAGTSSAVSVEEAIVTDANSPGEYAGVFITKYIDNGTYYIKERSIGGEDDSEVELAISGNKAASRTKDANQIVDGDMMYLVMPEQKAVLTSPVADVMKDNMMKSLGIKSAQEAADNFLSTGTEAISGTDYTFEEYQNGDETIKYYFDTQTLRYIKHISSDGSEQLYEIMQISKNIPDDMFVVPSDYTVQDLSSVSGQ